MLIIAGEGGTVELVILRFLNLYIKEIILTSFIVFGLFVMI